MSAALLSAALLSAAASGTIWAQAQGQDSKDSKDSKAARPAVDHEREFDKQSLTEKVAIPQLPEYTGQSTYRRGWIYPNALNGTSYVMYFATNSDPASVLNWYKDSLAMYGWKIQSLGGKSLSASHKEGHRCSIAVSPAWSSGEHCHFSIFYHAKR